MSSSSSSSSPPSPSSGMSFPIVIIAIVGILATATFLLAYYVFVIKCCLNAHRSEPDHIFRRLSRSRRLLHRHFSSASADSLRGLDPSSIRAIPTFLYGDVSPVPSAVECAVCLLEFRPAERLRRLPGCAHAFHVDCIDTWLESSASCPLCRAEVKLGGFLLDDSVVIEIGEVAAAGKKKKRKIKAGSMGDECVEVRREKDESFTVQPMRRSVSMGSSSDRKLLMAVQEAVRRNPSMLAREGSGGGGRMAHRLLFPFGRCRSSMRLAAAGPPEVMEV